MVEVFTALALAIFCTVFFLARGREMWTWFLNQLPSRVRDSWKTAGGAGWYTFSGYTRGTVIIAVTDGMLAFILLSVLRVPLVVSGPRVPEGAVVRATIGLTDLAPTIAELAGAS